MKVCRHCSESKTLDRFAKHSTTRDRLRPECNDCRKVYRSSVRQRTAEYDKARYAIHREDNLARNKAWREANHKAKTKYNEEWRRQNTERLAATNRAWRNANYERKAATKKAWREAHPEAGRVWMARRRARLRATVVEDFTYDELLAHYAVMEYDGCAYCGKAYEHDDHIVPLVKGGPHSRENLAPACARCNLSKGGKYLAEWLGFVEPDGGALYPTS